MATGQCAETCPSGYERTWSTNDHQMGRVCSLSGLDTQNYLNLSLNIHYYFCGFLDNTIFGSIKLSGQVVAITVGVVIGVLVVTTILMVVGMVVKFKKCSNLRSKSRMSPSLGPLNSGSHRSQGLSLFFFNIKFLTYYCKLLIMIYRK